MPTLDAHARADIENRHWYVLAYAGRDVLNTWALGGRFRPGRRRTSLDPNGFRVFDEPLQMITFGPAHESMPWEVWRVKPIHPLKFHPTTFPGLAGQLRTRSIEVVQRMPPGFEFGPHGATVCSLVEQLAHVIQSPPMSDRGHVTVDDDYQIGMTFLLDRSRSQTTLLHDYRTRVAATYLRHLTRTTGFAAKFTTDAPVSELLDAAVAGHPIPPAVALRWGLTDHGCHIPSSGSS